MSKVGKIFGGGGGGGSGNPSGFNEKGKPIIGVDRTGRRVVLTDAGPIPDGGFMHLPPNQRHPAFLAWQAANPQFSHKTPAPADPPAPSPAEIITDNPPPPLPQRDDPEIETERRRTLVANKLRKGRRSTILTSSAGVQDPVNASRPRASTLLGA